MIKFLFLILTLITISANARIDDLPRGCLVSLAYPCSLRSSQGEWVTISQSTRIYLGKGSVVSKSEINSFKLITGQAWFEAKSEVNIYIYDSPKKIVGEFWIIKKNNQIDLTVFSGEMNSNNPSNPEFIYAGMKKWWQMTTEGLVEPVDQETTLKKWNQFVALDKSIAIQKISEFKKLWSNRYDQTAELYQSVMDRRVAAEENRIYKQNQRRQKIENEKKAFRDMFREKYFNP